MVSVALDFIRVVKGSMVSLLAVAAGLLAVAMLGRLFR